MKQRSGFTLIELMIVVGIVAIISTIAYPSFIEQMQKSRRSDARVALMEFSARMERFFTENNTYVGANTPAAVGMTTNSPSGFYTLSVAAVTATTFTLNAAPGGAQATDPCGTLSLSNTNVRLPANCW